MSNSHDLEAAEALRRAVPDSDASTLFLALDRALALRVGTSSSLPLDYGRPGPAPKADKPPFP